MLTVHLGLPKVLILDMMHGILSAKAVDKLRADLLSLRQQLQPMGRNEGGGRIECSQHCSDGLQLYYQNVRGLNYKTDTFVAAISDCDYDIICLTETWLSDEVGSTEFFNTNYVVYRCDRKFGVVHATREWGVLLAVRPLFGVLRLDFTQIYS